MCDRVDIGELAWSDLEVGSAIPIAAPNEIARGTGSRSVETSKALIAGNRSHLIGDRAGIHIVGDLEVGVDQIVLSVHLIVPLLVSLGSLC